MASIRFGVVKLQCTVYQAFKPGLSVRVPGWSLSKDPTILTQQHRRGCNEFKINPWCQTVERLVSRTQARSVSENDGAGQTTQTQHVVAVEIQYTMKSDSETPQAR